MLVIDALACNSWILYCCEHWKFKFKYNICTICATYNQQWGLKRQHSLKNAFKDAAALRNFHSLTQQANSNLAHKDRIAFVFLLGHLQNVMNVVLFKKNAHCLQKLKADMRGVIYNFNFQIHNFWPILLKPFRGLPIHGAANLWKFGLNQCKIVDFSCIVLKA